MITMHILTYSVLDDYIDNLPVLFVINLFNILHDNINILISHLVDQSVSCFNILILSRNKSLKDLQTSFMTISTPAAGPSVCRFYILRWLSCVYADDSPLP